MVIHLIAINLQIYIIPLIYPNNLVKKAPILLITQHSTNLLVEIGSFNLSYHTSFMTVALFATVVLMRDL